MRVWHAEATHGVALEIEFDQHHRRLADYPAVVPGLDRDDLWSPVFHDTSVLVLDVDFPLGEEADVGVHASVGADDWLHVLRPPESGWIHHAFDARGARASDVQANAADHAALGAGDVGHQWIHGSRPPRRCRTTACTCLLSGGLSAALLLGHVLL